MAPWMLLAMLLLGIIIAHHPASALEGDNMNVFGNWKPGRATYYGTDAWSIHNGGCNYGHISPGEPLGWQVAAMTDVNPLYARDICGLCLEVKCNPSRFTDNYGAMLDRTSVCYNSSQSLVVRIVDTCPCTYADNAYSNKRWCCGDMDHLDLSYIAYGTLAAERWGVIGIQYRQVPCKYKPPVQAIPAPYATQDPTYNPSEPLPLRGWPEYLWNQRQPAGIVFGNQGIGPGWTDASWKTYVSPASEALTYGMFKTPGLCSSISMDGALALYTHDSNMFVNRTRLSFWMYVGVAGHNGVDAKVADITIGLSGSKGDCTNVRIWAVRPEQFAPACTYCTDYWWRWEFWLGGFLKGGDPAAPIKPGTFKGCGGNTLQDMNKISFRNDGFGGNGNKLLCLDSVMMY